MIFANYSPLEYWVLIPKTIEIILFVFLAVKIYKIKNYTLNKLYFAGFLLWALYIIINSVIYLIAANGEFEFQLATILHRLGISIAIIFAFILFVSALVVKMGYLAFKEKLFFIGLAITIIMCTLAMFTQEIVIVNSSGDPLLTLEEWNSADLVLVSIPITILTSLLLIVPEILILSAIIYLFHMIKTVNDINKKNKMRLLVFGIIILMIGMIYFVLIQLFEVVNIVTATIGHLIWTISPLLIWKSQMK